MKANKITLKKIRIEYLERIVDDIQSALEYRRNRLNEAKEELERVMTELAAPSLSAYVCIIIKQVTPNNWQNVQIQSLK